MINLAISKKVKVITDCQPNDIPAFVFNAKEPIVLKGLVAKWPLTEAGKISPQHASNYISQFYSKLPVTAAVGEPKIKGRIFYDDDFCGFNYQSKRIDLNHFFEKIHKHSKDLEPPTLYVASTLIDKWLPGFSVENYLTVPHDKPLVSIWLGNKSTIPAHFDLPDNIACCVVGKRKFTLFPPEQLANLYPGPLEFAPGGQAISLVDFKNPDFDKYPNFRKAVKVAQVAELESGDAIFIPSMWWHHVEALSTFNVLINYWWRQSPAYMSTPMNTLYHGLLTIRDLPAEQKKVWQGIFEHYVFSDNKQCSEHIPEHAQGFLSPIDEDLARKIRALLLNNLNR